jgi:erythronate-4-phosphate dehydrogenase
MKIIADEKIPFLRGVLEPFADIEYYPGVQIDRAKIADADALLIRTRTVCNEELLAGSKVKFIASATIGYDHIDTEYCRENDIFWTNAPGCNSGSVMQYIASAIVTHAKARDIDLRERTLGVVGVGNVGEKVVRMAELLGMKVVLNDPPRERTLGPCGFVSLDGILREADIITLHVPLNKGGKDRTFHMVDEKFLERLNKGTLIINSSRGEVLDTSAVKKGLGKGSPESVILDVWEDEPDIDRDLLYVAFLATPHIAGYSADGKANGTMMAIRALSSYFDLGFDDWEPDEIPLPADIEIDVDGRNKSFQEIVTDLILHTYNIRNDDQALRNSVSDFELLRGNYPLRREFGVYWLRLRNIKEEYARRLKKMGFRIID